MSDFQFFDTERLEELREKEVRTRPPYTPLELRSPKLDPHPRRYVWTPDRSRQVRHWEWKVAVQAQQSRKDGDGEVDEELEEQPELTERELAEKEELLRQVIMIASHASIASSHAIV